MKRIYFTIGCLGLIAAASFPFWNPFAKINAENGAESAGPKDHVTLTLQKFAAAGIQVGQVERREMRSHRTVPGRIEYDATRHVQVKSPFDGVIRRIDVKIGDKVTDGQVMAFVESPELGERRADILLRETDLQLAKNDHEWWHSIQQNLDDLIAQLKRPEKIEQVEKDFADKVLGDYRQQIVSAYSKMRLAEELHANIERIVKKAPDAYSIKSQNEVRVARDTTAAEYVSVCQQAAFDVKQKHVASESAMKNAARRLAVSKQRLRNLVQQPSNVSLEVGSDDSLSTWPVKAPFTATVEQVLLAPRERVQTSEGLFQLADTSRLWVQADIRERDWSALSVTAGQSISVRTEALPGKTLDATVSFVGRVVSPDTRAVPLTAEIDNADGKLRPGLFVRVLIPDGELRECLAVPQSSVTTNDGRVFVFVETGLREYHIRDVTTGLSVDPWIEITSGLKPGDKVVTIGSAILKAELLLEPEE